MLLSQTELQLIARRVLGGQVVGYPTETVWGLAVAPEFVQVLQQRKGRDAHKPLQVSCPDVPTALALAKEHPLLGVLAQFWPGPLTVITPAADHCPAVLAPGGMVGLRLPADPLAQQLLAACGPLASTSLNPAGEAPAITFEQAKAYGLADLLLGTAQNTAGGLASTVVQLAEPGNLVVKLVRLGALPAQELTKVLDPLGVPLEWITNA